MSPTAQHDPQLAYLVLAGPRPLARASRLRARLRAAGAADSPHIFTSTPAQHAPSAPSPESRVPDSGRTATSITTQSPSAIYYCVHARHRFSQPLLSAQPTWMRCAAGRPPFRSPKTAEGNPCLHYPGDYNVAVRGHRDIEYRRACSARRGRQRQVVTSRRRAPMWRRPRAP